MSEGLRPWCAIVASLFSCSSDALTRAPLVERVDDAGMDASSCLPITEIGGQACAPAALPSPSLHLAVDAFHACSWRDVGPVRCWGRNATGELGDPSLATHPTPVVVPGIADALQVTVADWGAHGFSCALLADRTVSCWGENEVGQLGDGTFSAYRAEPAPVVGLSDVVEIASGTNHSCARLSNGEARCWGMGRDCSLGDGSCADSAKPVAVVGLSGASQLALGHGFSCALLNDGTIRCWGSNGGGEVGDGKELSALTATSVVGLADVGRISASQNPSAQPRTDACSLGATTSSARSAPAATSWP